MSKTFLSNLAGLLGGLLVGVCLSVVVVTVLLYLRSEQILRVVPTATVPVLPTHFIQTPIMVITSTQKNLLDEAEAELESGHLERVKELLGPLIENWPSVDDKIRGYKLLGESELRQGHPQLAASYFEKLYFFESTAENLLTLAMVYDAGGDIRRALEKYRDLADWEDLPPEIDRETINWRIEDLERALGTPVPTSTPITP